MESEIIPPFPGTTVDELIAAPSPSDLSTSNLQLLRRELAEAIDRVEELLGRFEKLAGIESSGTAGTGTAESAEDNGERAGIRSSGKEAEEGETISDFEAQNFLDTRQPHPVPVTSSPPLRQSLGPSLTAELNQALTDAFDVSGENKNEAGGEGTATGEAEEKEEAETTGNAIEGQESAPACVSPLVFTPALPPSGDANDEVIADDADDAPEAESEETPEPEKEEGVLKNEAAASESGSIEMHYKDGGGYSSSFQPMATEDSEDDGPDVALPS